MRKLASIQTIDELIPIEGKDRIVLAKVLGWTVIVSKSDFNVGDKCIYVEIDSVLPEKPEFESLRKCNFRIKTMKMAGVISQGICFPLSILPSGKIYNIGDDVTKIIGITKYDPEEIVEQNTNKKKHNFFMRFKWYRKLFCKDTHKNKSFPDIVSKTDETRIQSAPFYLNDRNNKYVFTEKIDGTSGTFIVKRKKGLFKDKYEYIVCSRNMQLPEKDDSIYWKVSDIYDIKNVLKNIVTVNNLDWACIQGECVGPKIQKNKYKLESPNLYVFNLIYSGVGRISSTAAENVIKSYGMNFVPIIDINYLPETVDEMIDFAHGQSKIGDTLREGLVVRSLDGSKSFKAVDPKFLLKYGE